MTHAIFNKKDFVHSLASVVKWENESPIKPILYRCIINVEKHVGTNLWELERLGRKKNISMKWDY